jgi:hypothetical protein
MRLMLYPACLTRGRRSAIVFKLVTRGYIQGYAILTSVVFAALAITGSAIKMNILGSIALFALLAFILFLLMALTTSFTMLAAYVVLGLLILGAIMVGNTVLISCASSFTVFCLCLRWANFVSDTWRFLALRKHIAKYLAETGHLEIARTIVGDKADLTEVVQSMQVCERAEMETDIYVYIYTYIYIYV